MRPFSVCDAETDPFKRNRIPKPFVWGWYEGAEYKEFDTTEKFLAFISEYPGICYAHNGGKFDFHYLLDGLTPYDEVMIINGRIAKMYIGACELRDSYNIIPVPLSAYKKDDIDYGIMEESERIKPANKKKISAYLRSDCVYLYELIARYYKEYGANLTQAGGAMKQWVKISGQPAPRTDEGFYNEFLPYYYGGRVECFESGVIDTRFDIYDINSAYPRAMLDLHPYSENFSAVKGYQDDADFYTVRCVSHGAFPYRGLGGDDGIAFGLSFPHDDIARDYTITKWELAAAQATNAIYHVKFLKSYTFDAHVSFKDYVEYFYAKRLEAAARGDDAGKLLYKLAMNSLYGKFAANPAEYRNYIIVPMERAGTLAGTGWNFAGELGPWGLADAPLDESQQRYYNIATAASITGFVRAMLWRAIKSSGGVLYCDTDSLAVRAKGDDIIIGDKLGEWKHEGAFDRAGIAGKKLYIFRGAPDAKGKREFKTASKGVRLTNAQLWRVAHGETVTYRSESPTYSVKAREIGAAMSNQFFVDRTVVKTAR